MTFINSIPQIVVKSVKQNIRSLTIDFIIRNPRTTSGAVLYYSEVSYIGRREVYLKPVRLPAPLYGGKFTVTLPANKLLGVWLEAYPLVTASWLPSSIRPSTEPVKVFLGGFNTTTKIAKPTELKADIIKPQTIRLNWKNPQITAGHSLISYILEYCDNIENVWKKRTIPISAVQYYDPTRRGQSDLRSYSITDLSLNYQENKEYQFRLYSKDASGRISDSSNVFSLSMSPPDLLFRADFNYGTNIIQPKIVNAINKAINRWNKYIKFNTKILNKILSVIPDFKGIELEEFSIYNNPSLPAAKCVPSGYIKIGENQYNTLTYKLFVNNIYLQNESLTDDDWELIITHHLGHALGLGIYWTYSDAIGYVGEPDYALDGSVYKQTLDAYNNITGSVNKFIPLDNSGPKNIDLNIAGQPDDESNAVGKGTHWNLSIEDIMSYRDTSSNKKPYISLISIKNLVDLGYDECNPNTYESNNVVASLTISNEILCSGTFYVDSIIDPSVSSPNWQSINITGIGRNFNGINIAYGNGIYVALAPTSNRPRATDVYISNDGLEWNKTTTIKDCQLQNIAYGNGVFVATVKSAYKKTPTGKTPITHVSYFTSVDGISWTEKYFFTKLNSQGEVEPRHEILCDNQTNGIQSIDTFSANNLIFDGDKFILTYDYYYLSSINAEQDTWLARYDIQNQVGVPYCWTTGVHCYPKTAHNGVSYGFFKAFNDNYTIWDGTPSIPSASYIGYVDNSVNLTNSWTLTSPCINPIDMVVVDNRIVVVGFGRIAYSDNFGETWTTIKLGYTNKVSGVVWHKVAYGNGLFVTIGSAAIAKTPQEYIENLYVAYSSDGIAWKMNKLDMIESITRVTDLIFADGKFITFGFNNILVGTFDAETILNKVQNNHITYTYDTANQKWKPNISIQSTSSTDDIQDPPQLIPPEAILTIDEDNRIISNIEDINNNINNNCNSLTSLLID